VSVPRGGADASCFGRLYGGNRMKALRAVRGSRFPTKGQRRGVSATRYYFGGQGSSHRLGSWIWSLSNDASEALDGRRTTKLYFGRTGNDFTYAYIVSQAQLQVCRWTALCLTFAARARLCSGGHVSQNLVSPRPSRCFPPTVHICMISISGW
jgi:hypothetical protein